MCGTTIESKSTHDFKMCPCGSVGIDGGISCSNRILGNLCDMEDRSMYVTMVNKKKIWLPEDVITNRLADLQQQKFTKIDLK